MYVHYKIYIFNSSVRILGHPEHVGAITEFVKGTVRNKQRCFVSLS